MSRLQAFKVRYSGYPDEVIRKLVRVLEEMDERVALAEGVGPGGVIDIDGWIFGETPSGLINGSNATFVAAFEFHPGTLEVRVNGIQLIQTLHYVVTDNINIILTESPISPDQIDIDYKKLSTLDEADLVSGEVLTGIKNGVNVTYTVAFPFIPATVEIRVNGQQQRKGVDYDLVGANIVFTEPPQASDDLDGDYYKI